MESNYSATTDDFEAIEEVLDYVFDPKLNYIFKDKDYLKKISVIGFDSKFIYIWSFRKLKNFLLSKSDSGKYFMYKISHIIKINNIDRAGWRAGIWPSSINEYLPSELQGDDFDNPKISGSLMGDFINIQNTIKGNENNPYVTRESYLATVIHEFGHAYFRQYKNWWYSNKKHNLDLLREALLIYKNRNKKTTINIEVPFPYLFSEIFAFCCEYEASKIFLPLHKINLDKYATEVISKGLRYEKQKNLDLEDSIISNNFSHEASLALGIIIIERFPKTWPDKILKNFQI